MGILFIYLLISQTYTFKERYGYSHFDFTRCNWKINTRTGMTEDIEIENSDIYSLGKGSQCKYYIHDLKCSACFNFISNLKKTLKKSQSIIPATGLPNGQKKNCAKEIVYVNKKLYFIMLKKSVSL